MINGRARDPFFTLVCGLFALAFGLKMTHGSPLLGYLWTLPIALVFFALAFVPLPSFHLSWRRAAQIMCFALPVAFFIFGGVFFTPNHYVPPSVIYSEPAREGLVKLGQALQFFAALTTAACLRAASRRKTKAAEIFFQGTLCLAGLIALLVITAEPRPWIDVWTVQEGAARALLHLQNPYSVEHYNIYPKSLREVLSPFGVIFVYMPGIIYLMAPFRALGLDTRVPLILAHVLSALALSWVAKGAGWTGARRYVSALLFVSIPFVPFMLSMAWNDVLSVLFIPFVALALQRRSQVMFFASMIGLLLIKQHIALCFPLLFWIGYRELNFKFWRSLCLIGGGALTACLPFLLWNWRDFLGSLWGLHFIKYKIPDGVNERTDSFTLYYWLRDQFGAPSYLLVVTAGATLIASFWLWKKAPTAPRAMALCGMILMNTFAFATTSFLNYYWVPMGFFIVALATWAPPPRPDAVIVSS